jgi:acetyl esterase/lipase
MTDSTTNPKAPLDLDAAAAAMIAAMSTVPEYDPREQPGEFPLRDTDGHDDRERAFDGDDGAYLVRNVTVPTLTPHLPAPGTATGGAVLVLPGGGFRMLMMDGEGHDVAEWLRERGVAAFVLKYRLRDSGETHADFAEALVPGLVAAARAGSASSTVVDLSDSYPSKVVDDVTTALRIIRSRSDEWGVDPQRVGAIGFSAGSYALTWAFSRQRDELPDSVACIYGGHLSAAELPDTPPPLFAALSARDAMCATDALTVINAWREKGASVEAHLYDDDAHGFGLHPHGRPTDAWTAHYAEWLESIGYLTRS